VKKALLVLVAACNPHLYAASVPPPGALGNLDTKHRTSELTEGTVLAVRCEKFDMPCRNTKVSSDDPSVAQILPAALAQLEDAGFAGEAPASEFVIVGKKPGVTTVRVQATQGHVYLKVTVLPAPDDGTPTASVASEP
jgi:hypothetical protein